MTVQEIQKRITDIQVKHEGDDEAQHAVEDKLRDNFLKYLVTEITDPELVKKIKLVLSTNQLEFSRWCA